MTGFRSCGSDEGALRSPPRPLRSAHSHALGFHIFLLYEHLTRTAGSLDKHADTLCSRHQLNRAEGSREELPCGVKGQRPLGLPNKHAEEVCRSHQLNRAKGSPEGRRPFGGVKGQRPLRLPLYTKNSYFPCKSTKFEPEFRLNSGGFFFECVLYYMNEGSVRCKTDRNQTPPFRNDDAGEVGIVE